MTASKKKFHSMIFFNWFGYLKSGLTHGKPIIIKIVIILIII